MNYFHPPVDFVLYFFGAVWVWLNLRQCYFCDHTTTYLRSQFVLSTLLSQTAPCFVKVIASALLNNRLMVRQTGRNVTVANRRAGLYHFKGFAPRRTVPACTLAIKGSSAVHLRRSFYYVKNLWRRGALKVGERLCQFLRAHHLLIHYSTGPGCISGFYPYAESGLIEFHWTFIGFIPGCYRKGSGLSMILRLM